MKKTNPRPLLKCRFRGRLPSQDDIFRIKIKKHSIGDTFKSAPQGSNGRDYELALDFIKKRFRKAAGLRKRRIRIVVTTATDRDQAKLVLSSVLDKFTNKSLVESGFSSGN